MARPQAADYEDRRLFILKQAANLYAQKGYARSSISELATACGVSKALLYHYYPSKEAILFDIMHSHVTELLEVAQETQAQAGSDKDNFRDLMRRFMAIYLNAGSQHVILINDLGVLPEDKRQQISDLQQKVINVVLAMLIKINPVLADKEKYQKPVTMALMGMINWTYTWFNQDGPIDHEQYADLAVDLFLGGLMSIELPADG